MWLLVILLILATLAIITTKSDDRIESLKERYKSFIQILPPKYDKIKNRNTIITGSYKMGKVGENVNKGGEIVVCLDGYDENATFHILLHELAHSMVAEYDHSSDYWENFKELVDIASREGYYTPGVHKEYCGQIISDSL